MKQPLLSPEEVGRVAVLLGGASAEREISLKSGAAVLAALQRRGFDAHPFDPAEQPLEALRGFDRAFIALHGRGGEDGTIQGALEVLEIPYTGTGVLGSALGMDKWRTKQLWRGAGLPTPPARLVRGAAEAGPIIEALGLPLIVKPAREGSSIGMSRVEAPAELAPALQAAGTYDADVLVECWIDGEEFTVTLLENAPLPSIRLETPRTFYDFDAKYRAGTTQYHCPSGLDPADESALGTLALEAFHAVGGAGWGRVDVMRSREDGAWWLLEVNTIPGMTDHSLVPKSAAVAGIGFDDLVVRILGGAVR